MTFVCAISPEEKIKAKERKTSILGFSRQETRHAASPFVLALELLVLNVDASC